MKAGSRLRGQLVTRVVRVTVLLLLSLLGATSAHAFGAIATGSNGTVDIPGISFDQPTPQAARAEARIACRDSARQVGFGPEWPGSNCRVRDGFSGQHAHAFTSFGRLREPFWGYGSTAGAARSSADAACAAAGVSCGNTVVRRSESDTITTCPDGMELLLFDPANTLDDECKTSCPPGEEFNSIGECAVACNPGTEPDGSGGCRGCVGNTFSVSGDACLICQGSSVSDYGYLANAAHTTCSQEPAFSTLGSFRTECARRHNVCWKDAPLSGETTSCRSVPATSADLINEADGTCLTCSAGSYALFSGGSLACLTCPSDQLPREDRQGCRCPIGETVIGGACQQCPNEGIIDPVNGGSNGCRSCDWGMRPVTPERTSCELCPEGEIGIRVGNSSAGQGCEPCPTDAISSDNRTSCSCPANRYLDTTQNACVTCVTGRIPNANQTDCVVCRDGERPNDSGQCELCPDGTRG